jgi:predicted hydrocarbon binding protein
MVGSTDSGLSKEDLRELCFGLLREWWIAATQALVDEAGSETALTHLKPYFTNTGMAGAHNIPKIQGLTASEVSKRETTAYMWFLVTGGRNGGIFRADDRSEMLVVMDCATGGICKEACMSLCEFTNSAGTGEMNQGSEAVLSRSLSFGDPSCHVLFRMAGQKPKVAATDEFRVPDDEIPPPPDDELMDYLSLSLVGEAWSNATRAFVDFAGQDRARDGLRFHMRHAGLSFGIRMSERLGARERGLQSIEEIVELVQVLHHRKGTCTVGEGRVEGKVTECPFSSSSPEMCAQYEAFFNGICEAIDPEYEFVYYRMMTKGDKTCHWTIRKKGEPTNEKPKDEAASEDPAKNLALRFSKGEISLAEFERAIASLRKHGLVEWANL